MNKKISLLCVCICLGLCGCQKTVPRDKYFFKETERTVSQEDKVKESDTNGDAAGPSDNNLSEEERAFLDKYSDLFVRENAKRAALIYLDGDSIPELLILKDGEYRLYSFDGSDIKAAAMPDTEIKANAYGPRHDFEDSEKQTFYWFEYVPYKGLIRVHGGDDRERHDYYLKYTDGLFGVELEAKSADYMWHTYDAEKEIANEEFLGQLADRGYDGLIPCGCLYENVETAYENIGAASDIKKVLEDFVSGRIDALDYVEEISDIPEESFVMRSYNDFYYDINDIAAAGGDYGRLEYIDFDNDGEEELIICSYTGMRQYFDVIGDTVYQVLITGSCTTDSGHVAEREGKSIIERTDLGHVGRKKYNIMTYDPCCCLIDWFCLYTEYEGSGYSAGDKFEYRNNAITLEEFEEIVNSIHQFEADLTDYSPYLKKIWIVDGWEDGGDYGRLLLTQ